MLKPLPIGIQTFRDIIKEGYLYIDKTPQIYSLIRDGKGAYFLSRPRRFGKSLLISTLAEIFEGNRALFEGLWLDEQDYEWETYPILRLDFSQIPVKSAAELTMRLSEHLQAMAEKYQVVLTAQSYDQQLVQLITQIGKEQKVVFLVDEYDKPILDNIDEIEIATAIRDELRRFYAVVKSLDAYWRFIFLTGISKFSKVGVFSGLNNLDDLSMRVSSSTLAGITETELEWYGEPYLQAISEQMDISLDQLRQELRYWYNGFCFSQRGEPVYNPFSLLLFLKHGEFANHWFATGTPAFLLELMRKQAFDVRQLRDLRLSELAFSHYEIENLQVLPLLFQTGYLTIKGYQPERRLYRLGHPNFEVESAFNAYLLGAFTEIEHGLADSYLWQLIDALALADWEHFFQILNVFFANIGYELHIRQEKYYQTIFVLIFQLIGLNVEAEVSTNQGRIDAVVILDEGVYIFEFKLYAQAQAAIAQIERKKYAERYQLTNKRIYLLGVVFDMVQKQVWEWEVIELGDM
ncbi:MAG TPA: AAA family ATPase [Anaerolineae bacterium]|nr:AAA family ATPase [Anaerolineae bacterium]